MQIINFNNFYSKISDLLSAYTKGKNWIFLISLTGVFFSLFFACPPLDYFRLPGFRGLWKYVLIQIESPLSYHSYPAGSHMAKLAFRLTPPFFLKCLGLKTILGCLAFQFLCLIVFFCLISKLAYKISQDKMVTAFITLGFALSPAGNSWAWDISGSFDMLAFLLLTLALISDRRPLIWLVTLLASYADERALIASSFVFIWNFYRDSPGSTFHKFLSSRAACVIYSWLTYFVVRIFLITHYGFRTDFRGTNLFLHLVNMLPFGLWSGLKGFWILILTSLILLYKKKRLIVFFAFLASTLIIITVSMSVGDITRSMAYLFIAIFVSLKIIYDILPLEQIKKLVFTASLFCLFPTYFCDFRTSIYWILPFPLQLVRALLHK